MAEIILLNRSTKETFRYPLDVYVELTFPAINKVVNIRIKNFRLPEADRTVFLSPDSYQFDILFVNIGPTMYNVVQRFKETFGSMQLYLVNENLVYGLSKHRWPSDPALTVYTKGKKGGTISLLTSMNYRFTTSIGGAEVEIKPSA